MTDATPVVDTGHGAGGIWPLIRSERAALADDLSRLSDAQWATPSLCSELTVREVLAHLTAGASLDTVRWMAGVIRCRFDFDRQVAMRLAEYLGTTPAGTLQRFRSIVPSRTKPPLPVVAMLGETIVHSEDIRRPLGIHRDHPIETVTRVADHYRNSDLVLPAKQRIRGLRLVASDGPFAAGAGPLVSGTTTALVMAMAGRASYLGELEGDGVGVLRERCGTA
ncbi:MULTISPECIES: maleylpyruvate isomerase family mycothiol-dependent enzyme [Streptomyces]|uniref:Maleylpyruvate isomerase family mycothiol-dependent enzyme n=1 Tax=Streptomyces glycanivorans TaxID=3033808 RepID=A0ABY9JP13_9ACTN|nr:MULTISPECIES: maleylpyruvate isomerase family mycothiol-dependent enzyme [unclassified Streptomyces]WSQ81871.1 maleylpyruvate isomerase family mycothiol-dependent enzyme [Streptomyces sp. NBC_01213]WLQ68514.1 maleylpyruvate isomerase family mycothiol-dependent enzyme [Streptomyces sp. Alt3]WSQ89198.1 maleylpyruvate isomerase family mycothiol-dependent enzyme [Streptomyces sp. NBC_01212]WSR04796.1 maleylpyruvate isomerase family mycothiol-dependent enzyme [Streptomyces sp. NBC_01208]WSR52591